MDNGDAVTAYVGLGANLGRPADAIRRAVRELRNLPHTDRVRASSLYRSAPLGHENQPQFTNAVASMRTRLPARELLERLLALEARAGRTRSFANAPRALDLDLLLYGDQIIAEPGLIVPHPRMHQRRFVLEPLVELAPACVIPGKGRACDALTAVLDQYVVSIKPPRGP